MNCQQCGWWLCNECHKPTPSSDGQSLQAAKPSHGSAEDEQASQKWEDEEYEMFFQAICASLAAEEIPNDLEIAFAEDTMIALALSASLVDEETTSKRRRVQ